MKVKYIKLLAYQPKKIINVKRKLDYLNYCQIFTRERRRTLHYRVSETNGCSKKKLGSSFNVTAWSFSTSKEHQRGFQLDEKLQLHLQ
jgi:hypothetical protein